MPIYKGPFPVLAAWIVVPSLIVVTTLVLIFVSRRLRHVEIRYGSD